MKNLYLCSFIISALATTGCAGKFQLNEQAQAMQSSLTQESAMNVIESLSTWTPEQRGLCYSASPFSVSQITEFEYEKTSLLYEGVLTKNIHTNVNDLAGALRNAFPDTDKELLAEREEIITAQAKIISTNEDKEFDPSRGFEVKVSVPKPYGVDLTSVTTIRMFEDMEESDMRSCHEPVSGKYTVWLHTNKKVGELLKPREVRYNISEQNIDEFIAALLYVSPEAKVRVGAGF